MKKLTFIMLASILIAGCNKKDDSAATITPDNNVTGNCILNVKMLKEVKQSDNIFLLPEPGYVVFWEYEKDGK